MKQRWMRIGALALPTLMIVGTLATAAAPAAASAEAARREPVVGVAEGGFGRTDGVLSSRLSKLTTADLSTRSATQRSEAVGLLPDGPGSLLTVDGRYVVTIRVADTSAATQRALTRAGATITAVDAGTQVITANVAPDSLVDVGSVPGVQSVHEELTPIVGSFGAPSNRSTSSTSAAPSSDATTNAVCAPIVSEGDAQLKADVARATYGVDGSGVKVGVLSDSYNNLGGAATGVANGELPGSTNPCGRTIPVQVLQDLPNGGSDEGRGMAELVHDVAPGSNLAFATASAGEGVFANNIRRLASAGANVIVDDVTYFNEPMYQDGNISKAVNDVTAQGVSYYSSAGNENVIDNNGRDIGSYEAAGGYRPAGCPLIADGSWTDAGYADCHDFDPSGGVSTGDVFTIAPQSQFILSLGWSEPQFKVPTDYDIYLIDVATNSIISSGNDAQDDTFAANEVVGVNNGTGSFQQLKVVVARFKNSQSHPTGNTPRFKFVMFARTNSGGTPVPFAQFSQSSGTDVIGPTIFGHNAAKEAATVAAVPYNDSTAPETFSSRGPATYCWAPVTGTLVSSQAYPDCQTEHVDFAATDGGRTSFFYGAGPIYRFYGTSAAAPHAAGVAALQRDARPCTPQILVRQAQRTSARAVGAFGVGAVGSGLIDVDEAIEDMSACPPGPASAYHPVNPTRVLDSRNIPGNTGGYVTPWGPGISRWVDVTNTNGSGVPDNGVTAVVLNVTVTDTTAASFLTAYPDGQTLPNASNLNWVAGTTIANLVTVKLTPGGRVAFFNVAGTTNIIADIVGWYDDGVPVDGKLYNPTTPTRILESRNIPGNIGGFTTPWTAGTTRTLDVTGSSTGVVPAGATAVVLNVTVTDTTTGGFATVFPADAATVPTASNINWSPGKTIPNLVTVKLGTGSGLGKIKIYNAVGSANIIADVVGYYADTGSRFHALSPTRVLDSRFGNGEILGAWGGNQTRTLDVTDTGLSGVPSSGAQAVIMNVTVTDTSTAGFLTLFPANVGTVPNVSNLNWSAHDTIPNLTITKVPTSGSDNIKIYNAAGTTNVIADIVGWFG